MEKREYNLQTSFKAEGGMYQNLSYSTYPKTKQQLMNYNDMPMIAQSFTCPFLKNKSLRNLNPLMSYTTSMQEIHYTKKKKLLELNHF